MKINKTDLLAALETVKPGLASKETTIEQSTSFAFMNDRIVTYNDEISISHPVEGLEITGAVNANELYNLLAKLKKEEIEIDVENSELHLKCGKAKAGLTLQEEIKLPIDEMGSVGKWKTIPEGLLKAMKFAMGSTVNDNTQPILKCVHVNQTGFVEASDSFRISRVTLQEKLPVNTFLIPAPSVAKVVRMAPIKMAEGEGWIHFKTEVGTIISCRVYADDSFPDTTPFLKVKGEQVTLPETTKEVLEKAMVFCKGNGIGDETVEISLENGKLKIKSQSESGWFEEEIRIKYAGESIVFSITPYMLKDILLETLDCTISKDRLMFTGDNWVYVTVLRNN
jgi:DNA polymerase III sliding clamp (beta) subunit (PCNA family)